MESSLTNSKPVYAIQYFKAKSVKITSFKRGSDVSPVVHNDLTQLLRLLLTVTADNI